jgi:hypothetical protein
MRGRLIVVYFFSPRCGRLLYRLFAAALPLGLTGDESANLRRPWPPSTPWNRGLAMEELKP